jgi:hypothetical protein
MPIQSVVLIIIAVINLIFLGIVYLRAAKKIENILFFLSIIFNVFWSLGDAMLYGADELERILLGSQVFFVAPMFTAYMLLLFARKFHDTKPMKRWHVVALAIPPTIFSILIAFDRTFLIGNIMQSDINTFTVNKIPFIFYASFFSVLLVVI